MKHLRYVLPPYTLPPINLLNFRKHLPVDSPCVGKCRLDAQGERCTGCLRTADEISVWSLLTEKERWRIIQDIKTREQTS